MTDWRKEEIREQLDDLGAFRRDVEAERGEAEAVLEQAKEAVRTSLVKAHVESDLFARLERELDKKLAGIYQSTALWSHRAAEAGIPEDEVLRRLELGRGPAEPPEAWEYEN